VNCALQVQAGSLGFQRCFFRASAGDRQMGAGKTFADARERLEQQIESLFT